MKLASIIALSFLTASAFAATETVNVYQTAKTGGGPLMGTVKFTDTKFGLLVEPDLSHLPPGMHGFHIHEHASCEDMGMAAMGHLDPEKTGKHLGPYNTNGHLGDLPALYVDASGKADVPTLAPKLSLKDIQGYTLMIHEGGDNYSDTPKKLGGGGARVACGIIGIIHAKK